ncbi:uncharacterized protein K460DRAFT_267001, partial [Cucurbitaria berberidis CBS 394.84]
FDPQGLTENHTTVYTLTVHTPPRPPPQWLPSILTRTPVFHPRTGPSSVLPLSGDLNKPKYDRFLLEDLDLLSTKSVSIKSSWFPPEMRCHHIVEEPWKYGCDQGCYFVEKGGNEVSRWRCKRVDCEGHVYCGQLKEDAEGQACFGKRGQRLVCRD